ncbi:MAG: undecaprenyldiphospho-muramoylpentapeptide beta-N-acetylglucosaminyltransferase [Prolixibacteraceae bacterium]|nr:undecaprenyldiphospho-muramoylpentapeptide beta-N-acetylglucosaminyltransferase [Prolixibacteraceae bacterium]
MSEKIKIIISGGGTGGHIFPALSIANELKTKKADCEILFVGATGRMEMERVPAAGYEIVGLPVIGFPRKPGIKMITFFVNLARSMKLARNLIKQFDPDVVVGVGGYASGPILRVALNMKIPTLIQEQNSYAGITNRMLGKRASSICVAYDKMERYFPAEKIVHTGNPVRKSLIEDKLNKIEAYEFFKVNPEKKVILITGGSLGARTLNESVINYLELISNSEVEFIWQTGSYYYKSVVEKMKDFNCPNLHIFEFITRMDLAYAISDIVISRAGAGTISELCLVKKATILVPSPNVAEDHQTKNALSLVEKNAAMMVKDDEAVEKLIPVAMKLLKDEVKLNDLKNNIYLLAKPDASSDIADIVLKLVRNESGF